MAAPMRNNVIKIRCRFSHLKCKITRCQGTNFHPNISSSCLYSTATNPNDYCRDLVKKCDYEGYLCASLVPKKNRNAAFALRALYIELAQVQDVTTDKMRALMRFQFWKDSIDQMFKGSPPETPVAYAVTRAIEKHNLSKQWLTRILDARVDQLEKNSYTTVKEIEDLGENTVAALTYLMLETAGIKDVNADHAASHLGKCQALITVLRSATFHAKRNKVYIPQEVLLKYKVSEEQILRCQGDPNVKDAMFVLAKRAVAHLETARKLHLSVPRETYIYLLHSFTCDKYLHALQDADFDVFHRLLQGRRYNVAWYLWLKKTVTRSF